jgi:hypothetical protein
MEERRIWSQRESELCQRTTEKLPLRLRRKLTFGATLYWVRTSEKDVGGLSMEKGTGLLNVRTNGQELLLGRNLETKSLSLALYETYF